MTLASENPMNNSSLAEETCQSDWIIPDDARLEALAEFAAGAGHEINNPLATILGQAQSLLRGEEDAERRQQLQQIAAQALRIRDMIGDVMLFARPPKAFFKSTDLAVVARTQIDQVRAEVQTAGCLVRLDAPAPCFAEVDPTQFSIVLAELIRNARQAMTYDGGEIVVRLEPQDDLIRLTVSDPGKGLTGKVLVHAFDPFFSGREAGRGLGFGLCKIWQIVRMHGGTIHAVREEGRTIWTIDWPIQQRAAAGKMERS